MATVLDLPSQILSKIERGDPDECWEWVGAKQSMGYGMVNYRSKPQLATRLVYRTVNGPLGEGECVLHRCDDPGCVNPRHLFKGTHLDNMQDCKSKGRNPRGQNHNFARITEKMVLAIRSDPRNHNQTSKAFGISRETVRNIRDRRTWKHLPE